MLFLSRHITSGIGVIVGSSLSVRLASRRTFIIELEVIPSLIVTTSAITFQITVSKISSSSMLSPGFLTAANNFLYWRPFKYRAQPVHLIHGSSKSSVSRICFSASCCITLKFALICRLIFSKELILSSTWAVVCRCETSGKGGEDERELAARSTAPNFNWLDRCWIP